jgi:hypothetical protein
VSALAILLGLAAGLLLVATLRAWESAEEDLGNVTPAWRPPIERPVADPTTLGRIRDRWAEADHRAAKSRIRRVS